MIRLNVSSGAGGAVTVARTRFDQHLDGCPQCVSELCSLAQALWRNVCMAAVREYRVDSDGPKLDGAR